MFFLIPFAVIIILLVIILLRTIRFSMNRQDLTGIPAEVSTTDGARAADSLSRAVRFKTVSYSDYALFNYSEFIAFLDFLKERYPLVNSTFESEVINTYSIVYRWKGIDSTLNPLLLLGHYDVVPVEKGTEEKWKYHPFGGIIEEGKLWGRGSLDMKVQIISHLEAAEELLKEGFTPLRDIWFSYNFDEEQRGMRGASEAEKYFRDRGIRFDTVFDEGGCIVQGAMPGVEPPLALIGLGEKGCSNIRIRVKGTGGHSSMPPRHTALGKLSRIITDLENNPMPSRLTAPVREMLAETGPEMSLPTRIVLSNLFLFKPLLMKIFSANSKTNAMIRTSLSATMSHSGDAPNVLPLTAEAVINARLLPGDSYNDVIEHIKKVASKSCLPEEIEFEALLKDEASALSPSDTEQYGKIKRTINEFYPQALVSPYLMMGGSDSSKFTSLSDHVYRFMPILINNEELGTMHNSNEHISLENITRSTAFFKKFISDYS